MGMSEDVVTVTVLTMLGMKYRWNNKPAIRTILNDTIDGMIRTGKYTESQAEKLSQDAMVKKVMKRLEHKERCGGKV